MGKDPLQKLAVSYERIRKMPLLPRSRKPPTELDKIRAERDYYAKFSNYYRLRWLAAYRKLNEYGLTAPGPTHRPELINLAKSQQVTDGECLSPAPRPPETKEDEK